MTYRLLIAGPARRQLAEGIPEKAATAVIEFVLGPLLTNPHRVGAELRADRQGQRSARVGAYRVIYRIDESQRTVRVLRVAIRADVYRP